MALKKRGKKWHLRIRPLRGGQQIWVSTGTSLKSEAENIEKQILVACGSQDYGFLDPMARKVCLAMFHNQGWQIPASLAGEEPFTEELPLWKGIELCLRHPEVTDSANRERLEQSFLHLGDYFGVNMPLKAIRIVDIKGYQQKRLKQGASPSTINKEKAALSKSFRIGQEYQLVENNPCLLVRNLSEKSGQRDVYLGLKDFQRILEQLRFWCSSVVQTAFYSGLRRGEILSLTRKRISLAKRIMYFAPEDTKEKDWKRVPIHKALLPVFEQVLRVRALGTDRVFLIEGRPVHEDSIRKPWSEAIKALKLDPAPTFHDLRHSFVANCRRSGVSHEVLQSIVGHWNRTKAVSERYGRISDTELVQAIDRVTFDHGGTEIFVSIRRAKTAREESGLNTESKMRAFLAEKKKQGVNRDANTL